MPNLYHHVSLRKDNIGHIYVSHLQKIYFIPQRRYTDMESQKDAHQQGEVLNAQNEVGASSMTRLICSLMLSNLPLMVSTALPSFSSTR